MAVIKQRAQADNDARALALGRVAAAKIRYPATEVN